jgi:hypothetical protein
MLRQFKTFNKESIISGSSNKHSSTFKNNSIISLTNRFLSCFLFISKKSKTFILGHFWVFLVL